MMSKLLTTLALIAAVAAEAPYYSNRPSAQAPAFNYPAPAPQYTQPVASPAPAPAPAYYSPPPAYHAPAPAYQAPAPAYQAPAPAYQAPAPAYHAPAPPANQYVQYPPTINIPQPQPQYQSGYNYERPSIAPAFVQPQVAPQPAYIQQQIPANNALRPQPAPIQTSSLSQQGYAYNAPQQPSIQYASQQLAPQTYQQTSQQQYTQAFQSQPQPQINYAQSQFDSGSQLQQAAPAASSFNQQQHFGVLDSQVVHHVSKILAQNEQDYAKSLGSLQRVSGVSLEGANPSVELSSYVQNVPLSSVRANAAQSQSTSSLQELAGGSSQQSGSSSSGSQSIALNDISSGPGPASAASTRGLTSSYGLPSVVDNRLAPSSDQTNYNFVPTSQQTSSYGIPN